MREPIQNRILAGVLLIAFLGAAMAASGAVIEGPETVKAGEVAWFTIKAEGNEKVSFFPFADSPMVVDPAYIVRGACLFWTNVPGTYTVTGLCVGGTSFETATYLPLAKKVVVLGVPLPPNPIPIPGKINWVCLLYESADVTPTQATAQFNLEQYAKNTGHTWKLEDPSSSEQTWVKPLAAQAGAAGLELPVLIVGESSGDGKVPAVVIIKALATDGVAQLKGLGG